MYDLFPAFIWANNTEVWIIPYLELGFLILFLLFLFLCHLLAVTWVVFEQILHHLLVVQRNHIIIITKKRDLYHYIFLLIFFSTSDNSLYSSSSFSVWLLYNSKTFSFTRTFFSFFSSYRGFIFLNSFPKNLLRWLYFVSSESSLNSSSIIMDFLKARFEVSRFLFTSILWGPLVKT